MVMVTTTARPCGIYVSVADLKNAVSGTQGASRETIDEILKLMDTQWKEGAAVDVMHMAECFWQWQSELTKNYTDVLKTFEFGAIMERIKDDKIVPTIGKRSDSKQ